jgi:hypothetical protein
MVARGVWLLEREGHHTVALCSREVMMVGVRVMRVVCSREPTIIPLLVANQHQLVAREVWLLEREGHHTGAGCCQNQLLADSQSPQT